MSTFLKNRFFRFFCTFTGEVPENVDFRIWLLGNKISANLMLAIAFFRSQKSQMGAEHKISFDQKIPIFTIFPHFWPKIEFKIYFS